MPGFAGIACDQAAVNVASARLSAMESVMPCQPSWIRNRCASDSGEFVSVVFARESDGRNCIATLDQQTLVFDGELYGNADASQRPAEFLLKRIIESGFDALRDVEGRFAMALWCDLSKQLTIATDKFASKPVYRLSQGNQFAFCTSINALKASSEEPLVHDRTGIVQFFTFGHLWNNETFYESIKAASPASCAVFDVATGGVTTTQYWRPGNLQRFANDSDSLDAIAETLCASVRGQSSDADGFGVALSGGLDARTMLGLIDTDRLKPVCVSLGMEGSLDQKSARQLAEIAGCHFQPLILGEGFLENFRQHLERMVQLTDGHYLSQCIVMPTLPLYESLGVRTLLRGHAGELLHMHKAYNFSVDDSLQQVRSTSQLEDWLLHRLQSHLTAGVPEQLLNGMTSEEFQDVGRRSLQASLHATEHVEHPLDRVSQLFLDQRTRRETAMSMTKFNSVVEPRLPYLNGHVIDAIFAAPPDLRIGETVQTHILRKYRPEFLRPANSNTGAPVGVAAWRRKLAYLRMRVLAKLGVKGYQPYERLGLWLKQDLQPLVKAILLDDRCLDRGLLNPDCVRGVVNRHMNSKANHTYLILAMMIVELGMRDSGSAWKPEAKRQSVEVPG